MLTARYYHYSGTPEGDVLIHTSIAFIVIQILFVILRTWSRIRQRNGFIWGDLLIPVSLLVNIAICVECIVVVKYAAGSLSPKVIEAEYPEVLALYYKLDFYALAFLYIWAVVIPKLAILDVYLRIFTDRPSRWICYGVVTILVCYAVVLTAVCAMMCLPEHKLWTKVPDGRCVDIPSLFYFIGYPNVATDFIMLVLPIPTVVRLQASFKTKVGLGITFMTGGLGLIVSIIKVIGYSDRNIGTPSKLGKQNHSKYLVVETGIYLIAACLLALRPLLVYVAYQSPLSSLWSGRLTAGEATNPSTGNVTTRKNSLPEKKLVPDDSVLGISREGYCQSSAHSSHAYPSPVFFTTPPRSGILVEREVEISHSAA